MEILIYAPGIEVKVTEVNKVKILCDIVKSIMNTIFYEPELSHDVMTIHNENQCIAEVMLRPNPENGIIKGFYIRNKWYCLPDAIDVVMNIITNELMK